MSKALAKAADGCFAPAGSGAWYCKRRQLLRELPGRLCGQVEDRARTRPFQFRDLLFSPAGTNGIVHVVVEGRVRLVRFDADGGETQLAILEPGEAFREPRHGEVEALRICAEGFASGSLLSLDFEALRELVRDHPRELETLGRALD